MLVIFYHVDSRTILFDGPDLPCERCGTSTPGRIELYYRYRGVFWVFSFVSARYYYRHCDHCGGATDLPPREARAILGGNPIPLRHRYGFIGLVTVLVLLVLLSSR